MELAELDGSLSAALSVWLLFFFRFDGFSGICASWIERLCRRSAAFVYSWCLLEVIVVGGDSEVGMELLHSSRGFSGRPSVSPVSYMRIRCSLTLARTNAFGIVSNSLFH